ncbi:MAG: tRNA 2-thiouridine(34) synthase MnmA [Nitrospirota bacterium]|nr:tRNA 2-thiouridine(34) synthase MnmA [Nitrospirota bacterium]
MARILIGMSGGVDSSVAAALLAREGHQVTGVTLKLWDGAEDSDAPWQERSCCKVGIARHVCDKVGIPHRVVDLREGFRAHVVEDFLNAYERGETPNPCVRCNESVKITGLLRYAEENGFDTIATGHYARIERTGWGAWRMLGGVDPAKDQSYFLYRIPRVSLGRIRFPLGGLRKPQVMQMARDMGLPADEIAESQEICFVGGGDYRDFLRAERPAVARPGDIVDTTGRVLGRHAGVALHTIGQRRGLQVSTGQRAYVVSTDAASGRVVVGPPEALDCGGLIAGELNLLAPFPASGHVRVRLRHRGALLPAGVTLHGPETADSADARDGGGMLTLHFDTPQRAVAPGQSAVLYDGDTVLGGGIIRRALPVEVVADARRGAA